MGVIRGIFSLEEAKVSTIMIAFIAFSVTGIMLLFKTGNIPAPLAYIIISLAGFIVGANVAPSLMSMVGQQSGVYGGSMYGNYNMTGISGYNTTVPTTQSQSTVTITPSNSTDTNPV